MDTNTDAKLLRIFISSTDKFKYRPLYEVIVFAAKRYGLAGATVLKGFMGYGASSVIRSQKLWEITEKLPLVIEIVDAAAKIHAFLPTLETMLDGGLVTLQPVQVIQYRHGRMPE